MKIKYEVKSDFFLVSLECGEVNIWTWKAKVESPKLKLLIILKNIVIHYMHLLNYNQY